MQTPVGRAARGILVGALGGLLVALAACSANLPTYDPLGARELPAGGCDTDADCSDASLRCVEKRCVARADECADDSGCTRPPGDCSAAQGRCVAGTDGNRCTYAPLPETQGCDDHDLCTQGDHCDGHGACVPGSPRRCNEGSPCAKDVCDPKTGCPAAPVPDPAKNGVSCGEHGKVCQDGVCQCGTAQHEFACADGSDDDCDALVDCADTDDCAGQGCDDHDPCTEQTHCAGGTCQGGTPVACTTPPSTQCFAPAGHCDSSSGAAVCVYDPTPGVRCDDGDPCTVDEACDARGACTGGKPLACNTPPGGCFDAIGTCDKANGGRCTYKPKSAGVACDDGDLCTEGESCDGQGHCGSPKGTVSCPAAACASGAGQCNPASGKCEYTLLGKETTCRPALPGGCDVEERCDGQSPACPADKVQAKGAECRKAAGPCDVAEVCDGASNACPADRLQPTTVQCRAAVPGTPPATSCDVAEYCTGLSADCPPDKVASKGLGCRTAQGLCDVEEQCDGAGPLCPVDRPQAKGVECRRATDLCDAAEVCDGASVACPPDRYLSGVVCRNAVGPCDAAETCSGASPQCPPDGYQRTSSCPTGVPACYGVAYCDGTSVSCTAAKPLAQGTCCTSTLACDGNGGCTQRAPLFVCGGF